MKNTLLLLLAIPTFTLIFGYKKLNELKAYINNLDIRLKKIYNIKIEPLQNKASFLADFTIINTTGSSLNLQSFGFVALKRVLFYQQNGELLATALVNMTSIQVQTQQNLELSNIPFSTKLTNGIIKLQAFLKNKENSDLVVELEFEAFGKIYKTGLK